MAGLGCWPREGPPARGTAVGNHQSGQRNTGAQEDCADSEDADRFRPHGGQGEASVARGRRASGQQRLDHRRIAVVSGCSMQRRSLPGTAGLGTGSGTKANFHILDRCRPEKHVRVPHPAILRRQNRGTALAEQNFGNGHIICLFGQMQRRLIPHILGHWVGTRLKATTYSVNGRCLEIIFRVPLIAIGSLRRQVDHKGKK